ncbi:MAG TPA: 3-hydroxy-3-methylglutaryl-CoA reductase, partial [Spirochaetia bacterium]|nr:3-hydroxy-3-methylglutaryl-CoA reductase [Spirochaetia bacterium]
MHDPLPSGFRKASTTDRRTMVTALDPAITEAALGTDPEMIELADVMVESSVGYLAVPLGIAAGFQIDGSVCDVPLATEEPSVIAAASYGASIVRRGGGFTTVAGELVTTGQLFVEATTEAAAARVSAAEDELRVIVNPLTKRMESRGGGWKGMDTAWLPETGLLRVQVHIDARDAMGANIVNSIVEELRSPVETLTGGRVVMAILTNASDRRVTTARFSVKTASLARAGVAGPEAARRIVL